MCGANGFVPGSMDISCTLYQNDGTACRRGTYAPTGVAREGNCTPCPPHLPLTMTSGAILLSHCVTQQTNLFSASMDSNRITMYSPQSDDHQLVWQGAGAPLAFCFVTELLLLAALFTSHVIIAVTVE